MAKQELPQSPDGDSSLLEGAKSAVVFEHAVKA